MQDPRISLKGLEILFPFLAWTPAKMPGLEKGQGMVYLLAVTENMVNLMGIYRTGMKSDLLLAIDASG